MKSMSTQIPKPISIPAPEIFTGFFDFTPEPKPNKKAVSVSMPLKEDYPDLLDWTIKKRQFLGPSRPFDLTKHRYLVGLYRCRNKEVVVQKASQIGVSEYMLSYAIHAADQRSATVLYVLATESSVSDFSTARLGPALEASSYLSSIVVDGSGNNSGMRGSDRITLKRIRDRFLYFRGSKVGVSGNSPQLKSIDASILLLDEYDELDPRAPAIARKRLGHANEDCGNVIAVSTPSYPNVGINELWQTSDQRLWHVKCEHCGERQPLEISMCVTEFDSFGRPYSWHGQEDYTAWLACRKCGGELDRLADGEWVATYPDRQVAGFHVSKLFSAQMRLLDVVYNADTVDDTRRKEWFNQDLGLPYLPRGGHLEADQIDACRGDYGHGPDYYASCAMGVDIGRTNHVVIRTMPDFTTGRTRQLYCGTTDWDGLDRLVKIYRPRVVVVDALPETSKAREFQEKYPRNMVWLSYYVNQVQGNKREQFAVFDVKERKVLVDRTRSLDATFAGFYAGTSTLPHHIRGVEDYYNHLRSCIRILKEDSTGQEVATYMETGPDHYAHACNYVTIAQTCRIGFGWSEGASG